MENKFLKTKNKIFYMLKKVYNKLIEKKDIILIFSLIFVFIWIQHSVVAMYFDDYGNASLSYAKEIENVEGTNYTLSQLLEWAHYIYYNFGGRILYSTCVIIPLLKNGIIAFMNIQSIVITAIIYFMYKIITFKCSNNKNKYLVPAICFILYTIIDIVYLRHGIYWASASVLYIWPLLPFFSFIYLYMKICDNIKEGKKINYGVIIPLSVILNFFTAFSHEQIGIAFIAFEIAFIILHHIKYIKKFIVFDIVNIGVSVVSYLVFFLAPGNWVRMGFNKKFASFSTVEKITYNFPKILKELFENKMNIYIYILSFLCIYMVYVLIKDNYKKQKKYFILFICALISLIEIFIMFFIKRYYNEYVFNITRVLWLVSTFIVLLFYFNKKGNIEFCSLYVAAFCSAFCLLISPSILERSFLPLIFFLIVIITKVFINILSEKSDILKLIVFLAILVLGFYGIKGYIKNYEGYRDNYIIYKLNSSILKNYNESDGKTVDFYVMPDTFYGSDQPYFLGKIQYFVKEYYNIPQDVKFNIIDIFKSIRK